jgi:SAM-dependent methyltransferase
MNTFLNRRNYRPKGFKAIFLRSLNDEKNAALVRNKLLVAKQTLGIISANVLEVGAGYGRLLRLLEVDPLLQNLIFKGAELNSLLISNKVCKADIEEYNLLDEPKLKADIVFCWAVLHYFSDDEIQFAVQNLQKIASIVVIFELPNVISRIERALRNVEIQKNHLFLHVILLF